MRSLFLVITVSVLGCEEKKPPVKMAPLQAPAPAPVAAADPNNEARDIFNLRCAACHGPSGKGDGAAAAALNPKPRDMSDAAWQKSVSDEHLAKVIVEGGAAVGKSPLMAPNPDLKDKTAVLTALVKHVRSLGTGAK